MAKIGEMTVGVKFTKCCECERVEVIRCKDCTNWMHEYDDVGLCAVDVPDIDGVQRHANGFCSYGERRRNGK